MLWLDICIFVAILIYKLRILLYTSFTEFVYGHKMLPLKVCHSVVFSIFTELPSHCHYLLPEYCLHSKKKPHTSQCPLSLPRALVTTIPLCLYGFADSELLIQVDQTLTYRDVCTVHSCNSMNQHFIPFCCQRVSHCIRNHILLINHE